METSDMDSLDAQPGTTNYLKQTLSVFIPIANMTPWVCSSRSRTKIIPHRDVSNNKIKTKIFNF